MKRLEQITAMSSKGQIVIPRNIRQALGLRAGDRFAIEVDNNILAEARAEEFAQEREH